MTGDRWLVSDVFLSIGRMAGSRWPGTYTPPGTSTLGVATWMGPPQGSRAMWGGDPIQFSSSDESDMVSS